MTAGSDVPLQTAIRRELNIFLTNTNGFLIAGGPSGRGWFPPSTDARASGIR